MADLQCPKCGSLGYFGVSGMMTGIMTGIIENDRGRLEHPVMCPELPENDYTMWCMEPTCEHQATVRDFKTENQPMTGEAATEIERLREALEDLVVAAVAAKSSLCQAHQSHWDPKGTHGANCPACKKNSDAVRPLRLAITKADQALAAKEADDD